MDISTRFSGISLDNCLYNASGAWCMTIAELVDLDVSCAGALVAKSCTLQPREGNPEPRYFPTAWGSINSMGLPNLGITAYLNYLTTQRAPNSTKPFFLSVAGLSLNENLDLLQQAAPFSSQFAAIELNLSCPNIPGKPQTGYDVGRTAYVLEQVFANYQHPLGVKLPPYFDMAHFDEMAAVLNNFPLSFVTCINSIGNGLVIDPQTDAVVIKPKGGFGGIGGDYIKPTALANVRRFYELLKPDIAIIGCGGVRTGRDAYEHILCGASAVQIGSQLMHEGPACFMRIAQELKSLMAQKGHQSLQSFKGKLLQY